MHTVEWLCEASEDEIEHAYEQFVRELWQPALEAHGEVPGVFPESVPAGNRRRLFLLLCHGVLEKPHPFMLERVRNLYQEHPDALLPHIIHASKTGMCG
jgi:hypothetical protein